MAKTYLVGFRRRELGKWSSYEDFKGIPTKVRHCRFMIYKILELDWTFVFRVRDRFSQNYIMRTWSGFRMTRHISLHFFRKLCERGTWNLVCKKYPYGLIYKKKFQVPQLHSIGEKCDASSSYQHIFLENCADEEHEIWFANSIHMV